MDALFAVLLLGAIFVGVALLYKNRYSVLKWLNDSSSASNSDPRRRRRLLRRKIEDAEDELAVLDEMEQDRAKK